LQNSQYANVLNNNVTGHANSGIALSGTSYSNLTGNNASSNNRSGIELISSSNYNRLVDNVATDNVQSTGPAYACTIRTTTLSCPTTRFTTTTE